MTRPNLQVVQEAPVDISRLLRADIEKRDWAAVHVSGDRNPPLGWMERVKRTWIK